MEVNHVTPDESYSEGLEPGIVEPSVVQKRSRKRSITIFVVVSILNVALLGLLWTQLLTPSQQASGSAATAGDFNSVLLGKQAPDLTLATSGGLAGTTQKLHFSQFKGKPVIINFWASWCGPCNAEAPFLQKNVSRLQSQGVQFISINAAESPGDVAAFNKKYGITYASVEDTITGSTSIDYGVTTFPMTVFINRDGIIKAMWRNTLDDASLKRGLSKITS
ncbi:MAG: TlpA disulfide reductase family protein [Ktedonobacteraceae bacterium]